MPIDYLPQRQRVVDPSDVSHAIQVQYAKGMLDMTPGDGLGVAIAYLVHASTAFPDKLRTVLKEPVVREGFAHISILELLQKVCK